MSAATFAGRVLAAVGPAFRAAAGELLVDLVDALTEDVAATDDLLTVADGAFGTAPLADLARTPFPHWLGQLAGLTVPARLSADEARIYVTGRGVSRRGTLAALKAAAAAGLTGTRRVDLFERDGSPWRLTVWTYATETPDGAVVLAGLESEKPVGIVLTYEVREGQTLGQLAASGDTLGALSARTYDDIRSAVPRG